MATGAKIGGALGVAAGGLGVYTLASGVVALSATIAGGPIVIPAIIGAACMPATYGVLATFGVAGAAGGAAIEGIARLGERALSSFQTEQNITQTNQTTDALKEQNTILPKHVNAVEAATNHHRNVAEQVISSIGEKIDGANTVTDRIDAGAATYEKSAEKYREQANRVRDLGRQINPQLEQELTNKNREIERLKQELKEVIQQRDQIIATAQHHIIQYREQKEKDQKLIEQYQNQIVQLQTIIKELERKLTALGGQ